MKVLSATIRGGVLLLLMASPSVIQPQEDPPARLREDKNSTIKVNVDVVVLHASTRNRRGTLVSGLGKEAFQVYENGVLQQIKTFSHDDIPVTVGLVVDNSGSMIPKHAEVIAAAVAFARSSHPADQMFVVTFNENVSFGLPARAPFTDKPEQLRVALSKILPNGKTALYDAVAAALQLVKRGNRDKRVLIVVSDGADNASQHKLEQIMTMAGQSDVIIYTVGLFEPDDPDKNPAVLKRLANATGGDAFLPESIKEVAPAFEQIARDIRNQYTLTYTPANRSQDGTYRTVLVTAVAPGRGSIKVRTRAGYYAPSRPPPPPATSGSNSR
jgi:Ca-activated chloride channel family protein